ncbi:MAG: hypothetical protein JNM42_07570 [Propionivibrio sp.]|uniref:hypothetical protein n=1 Tax=Propionivibrio sp. TaxID=2212460 RepID=UPI001A4DF575|nr:hypothetical protein [Propionivibrio sp.]MBL8414279.1 hypothetical protein [Propionivibrio sp.]
MIQHIIDKPWIALALLLVLVLLHVGVAIRIRREDRLKDRACIDRREMPRPEADRRKDQG